MFVSIEQNAFSDYVSSKIEAAIIMTELVHHAGNNTTMDSVAGCGGGIKKFKVLTTIEKTIETTVEIGSNYVTTSKTACHVVNKQPSLPKNVSK